ncbi:MAG: YbaK/EbsC family protein [Betaproteobacteria bacterium]|nr:MAG: YbaK/EbsC family protein [Betaproteobacteria bacterium]
MSSAVLNSASVERVRDALARFGIAADIVELPGAARTAAAAAAFLGCEVAQIANSLVFRGEASGTPLLVMSSGAQRVDARRLGAIVGEAVGKADAAFVRAKTGFAIGGVAPVGHVAPLRTFVERSLAAQRGIWAAAGHPHTVFRLEYAALLRITGGLEVDAAE